MCRNILIMKDGPNIVHRFSIFFKYHQVSEDAPMNSSIKRDPDFCLHFSVSKRPIILLGLGLFLPHGENICGDLRLTGSVKNAIDDKYITYELQT